MDDNQPIATPPTPVSDDQSNPAPSGDAGMPVMPEPPMAPPVPQPPVVPSPPAPEPMPTPAPVVPQQMPDASNDAVEPGSEITPVADPPAIAEDVAPTEQMPPQN